jgi:Tol biopolymer transport system component
MKHVRYMCICFILTCLVLTGCREEIEEPATRFEVYERESKIPSDAVKITPETDDYPPRLHSEEYEEPVPLPYPINTAGAEDSPFILPDGRTFYFVFVPDVGVPAEKQIVDGVTGIYVSTMANNNWSKPERVVLNDDISLDGCQFVQGNTLWFCSVREGYTGVNWFTAEFVDGKWQNWQYAGDCFAPDYEVGELHISADGNELYFHSARPGGEGKTDIWVTKKVDGEWQIPENIAPVNTEEDEGMPFISQDGTELWFNRRYMGSPAIFRSKKIDGQWSDPELIISWFAGEPSLDNEGNIYFVHHFYKDGTMIEADIYVAKKK